MVLVEVVGYSLNEMLCTSSSFLQCFDVGGGMQVFYYGAVFGVVVVMFLSKEGLADNSKKSSGYASAIFSLIGTLFMWVYWPAFSSALAVNTTDVTIKEVVSTNTIFALVTSTLTAFIFTMLYNHKLNVRDIGFASLSGAVAIASGADLIINIGGVMLVSLFVGWISVSGYNYFSRYL
jgi:ammonium transporter Rh